MHEKLWNIWNRNGCDVNPWHVTITTIMSLSFSLLMFFPTFSQLMSTWHCYDSTSPDCQPSLLQWYWGRNFQCISLITRHIFRFEWENKMHIIWRVISMLMTDFGDQMCWWQIRDDGDRFRMLVTDSIHWENHQHNEKGRQHNDSAANIWNQSSS